MQEKEQNISPIKQRILQFIDDLGISKRDFYEKTGISRGTLESKTGITEETLAKFFATYADADILFILTGEKQEKKQTLEEMRCLVNNCDFMAMIDRKDQRIIEMSKEIGRLENELLQYKKSQRLTPYNNVAEP